MIDYFSVFTTGGIVLWQQVYQPVSATMLDALVTDAFIEDRKKKAKPAAPTDASAPSAASLTLDRYTIRWTTANDLGLIFVTVYQSLLQITFIDELLSSVKKLFTTLYAEELKDKDAETLPVCKFDDYFAVRYAELEKLAAAGGGVRAPVLVDDEEEKEEGEEVEDHVATTSIAETAPSTPSSPSKLPKLGKPGPRRSARSNKNRTSTGSPFSSGTDDIAAPKKSGKKKLRKWDFDGTAREADSDEDGVLDFSSDKPPSAKTAKSTQQELEDEKAAVKNWGAKNKSGDFILKELSNEINTILATSANKSPKPATATSSALSSGFDYFKKIMGSKALNEQDLDKALVGMKDHLMKKNVAPEVAQYLCDVVSKNLVGTKTGSWNSVETTVRATMEDALRKILTPSTSVDLLHEINSVNTAKPPRPYVISVVGVNGVGKSTNLSKIAFWLLQNNKKLLVAACDTFRSGAVEQLRIHVQKLTQLSAESGSVIELYEKGYNKDAAVVARDAIAYGKDHGFDVVLIDTAGRRHNDTRLMSSLEKFAKYANPDKIVMVGEALVGTDSVAQARNFNAAFGTSRNLDFFLISKCDTVGDMIGSMVNMTYSTGIPVLFVGTGQTYTDLRTLSVPWAVNMLMS
ncbi:SRP54-type protein [Limtongia smithiae]|uniref:SRP54-type protein n=1 Tax=Limtongia smithiae TaxID=1125753 RepID=UPI0034CE4B84